MNKSEWIYGYHALRAALETHPECLSQIYLQSQRNDDRSKFVQQKAKDHDIPIQLLSRKALTDLLEQNVPHQGMIAACTKRMQYTEADLEELISIGERPLMILILDGIQDPHNLGAILRTAYGMGVHVVIAPKDKAVGLTASARKVASGAAEMIPFVQVTNLARTMRMLQENEVWIVGADAEAETQLMQVDLTGNVAVVMGGEEKGMRRLTEKHCDFLAKIPMVGAIGSLNVSVATGMVLYEILRQRA